jgi:hypothetical protein
MDSKPASPAARRATAGRFLAGARGKGQGDARDGHDATSVPSATGANALDSVRSVFWQAWRHLFPPHSLAAQTSSGNVVISWSVVDDPHAHYSYATPVLLRFDADLLAAMQRADARSRIRIAQVHESALREGLRGYDPFSRFPHARVINIG